MIINKSIQNITSSNDSRTTKWGRILRKYKLDEIPQLVNIMKGEMSFVGPRPEIPDYISDENNYLNHIKPGLTGLSSIIFINEEKILNQIGGIQSYGLLKEVKNKIDSHYYETKNPIMDILIVIITLLSFLSRTIAIKIIYKYFISGIDKKTLKFIKTFL